MEHVSLTRDSSSLQITGDDTGKKTVFVSIETEGEFRIAATLDAHAEVEIITFQLGDGAVNIQQEADLGEGAIVHWKNVSLGAQVQQDLVSRLEGAHAESNVDWVFYAKQKQQQNISARNVFIGAYGEGEITMKGVAQDNAHVVCNGMIDIGLQGGGTNTYLTEDVLMLDSTAKVDAIPGLEIKTNDVKASHSATVSRVTEEDLFYFGSRGIAPDDAKHLYVQGFLSDLLARIEHEELREKLIDAVEEKYAG